MTTQADQYFLGHRKAEEERLQRQALELAGEATWLFDQIGIKPGSTAVDLGCGPRGCLDLLSERVGESGSVIGVERSEETVALARRFVEQNQLGNVEVRQGDARSTGLPRESFDLATTRLVLVNVPEPQEIIQEAVAVVRRGGAVAYHEADYVAHVCDPPLTAWSRIVDLLDEYSRANGIDLFVGRKLPRLLREAGLVDVQMRPIVHLYPAGHPRRSILLDFADNLGDRIVALGLIAADELQDLKQQVRAHLDDDDTLVVSHLFLQSWGRKP